MGRSEISVFCVKKKVFRDTHDEIISVIFPYHDDRP